MADVLTDEDIAKLDAKSVKHSPSALTDDDIAKHDEWNASPSSGISKGESFGRGAAQGATLGFGDELSSALSSIIPTATDSAMNRGLLDRYQMNRDQIRKENESAQQANPWSYVGGNVVGGLAPAVLSGGSGLAADASVGQKIYAGAQTGARFGAATGLGSSNADLTTGSVGDLVHAAEDTGKGMILGAATGGATEAGLQALSSAKQGVANYLRSAGNEARVASLGPTKGQLKKLMSRDRVQKVGQYLDDKNIVGPFTSRSGIEENLENDLQRSGGVIGDTIENADTQLSGGTGAVPVNELTQEARASIVAPLLKNPIKKNIGVRINDLLDEFDSQFEGQYFSLEQMQGFKKDIEEATKAFEANKDTASAQAYRDLYQVFNKKVESTLQNAEDQLSSEKIPEGTFANFKGAKSDYGNASTAQDIVRDKLAREGANRTISPTDYIASAAGYMKGGKPGAIALGALNHAGRKFGNQIQAWTYGGLSKLLSSSPQVFGKYTSVLQEAAQKGIPALTATDFVMQQKYPDYKSKVNELMNQQEGDQ